MDSKAIRNSVSQAVKNNAAHLKKAAPAALAIALVSASLLPVIQQSSSPEILMGVGILSGMGTEFLKEIGKNMLAKLGKKKNEEILQELENEIMNLWNAPGEKGAAFRRELSQFLQRNGILKMALDAAPQEAREGLAQSFASLADQFEEFGWVLDEIKETLGDIQKRQVEQLATQREQLDLQREQLTKTNLLLKLQRERKGKPAPAAPQVEGEYLPPADIPCPYKGLTAFQPQDAEYFFGREELTAQLLARLAGASFLAVIGPSGSGKSSLVRAGLVPALWKGEIPSSADWKVLIVRPGETPLEELAVRVALQSGISASSLLADLRQDAQALRLAVKQFLVSQPEAAKFVLVLDQFEEVFTQCEDEHEREQFIAALVSAIQGDAGRTVVILTLRADFYGRCAAYPALADLLSANQALVGAMSADELRRAIRLPAERAGLALEPGLVEMVLQDAQGEAGALPMVSHALMETWKRRRGHWLKVDAYRAFGGLRQAIASTAEEVYAAFTEAEREQVCEIFLRLTRLDESASAGEYRDARRRVSLRELIPAGGDAAQTERLLDKLADARLIVKDVGRGAEPEVEVAHEALIQHWDRLRGWLNDDRDALRLRQGVSEAAREWEAGSRDENLLLHRGGRLEDALKLRGKLNAQEQAYVEACNHLVTRERKAREKLRRNILTGLASGMLIALLLAGFALYQMLQAQQQTKIATARQLAAQAQALVINRNSKQMSAVLLAIQSMQMFPTGEAAQILQKNTLADAIASMAHDAYVHSVAFSPNGKYVVSGSRDGTARVWEASTGKEIARMSHGGIVVTVAFGPDGKFVVSGGCDQKDADQICAQGSARVWEAATGKEIARMTHDDKVTSVAFSPDGKYVVSGSKDKTARVWEAATGKEIARMTHDDEVTSVAFSPDGKYVVSGSNDKTARVWEIATGKEIAQITHDGGVSTVTFSPDGKYVVSGSGDLTARVWAAATGKEIARMTYDGYGWILSVAFSPDGKYVVSGSNDMTARVWEAATGKEIARMTHDGWVNSVTFSPDGRYVVSGSNDKTARVWEVATGKEIARMTHDGIVFSAAFSPDGKYVTSGSEDGTARVWEAAIGNEIAHITNDDVVNSVVFSPDNKYVAFGSQGSTSLVWDIAKGKEVAHMPHDFGVNSVAFSPNGKYMVSGSDEDITLVWEATTGKEIGRMVHNNGVFSVTFSPDSKYVASGSWDNTARVWETTTSREIARMTHDDKVNSVAFSPNDRYVVSGSNDGTARVWEAATGKEIARMTHDGWVNSVTFSPDGKYVVSGSNDKTARVWEVSTGKEIARMTHNGDVYSVGFSPDGKYVTSGSEDSTARVWDAYTGKEIARMAHDDKVNSVAFSPDSKYVISGSYDKTARVWEAATGKETARMTHNDEVKSVAFSPNGKFVVSGSRDDTARVWLYRPADLITEACSRVTRNLTRVEWLQYIGDALPYQAICPELSVEPEPMPTVTPTP